MGHQVVWGQASSFEFEYKQLGEVAPEMLLLGVSYFLPRCTEAMQLVKEKLFKKYRKEN